LERHRKTLTESVKKASKGFLEPAARFLLKAGVEPNLVSFFGFLLAVGSGTLAAAGRWPQSGCLFLISGLCDALDGTLARIAGRTSRFGAFFDSFMDRYGEAALFFGIIFWSARYDRHDLVLLSVASLVGSFMVSYARARAEGLGVSCKIGLFSRLERFMVLVLALIFEQLFLGVAVLAVMTHGTAIQRMVHVGRQLKR